MRERIAELGARSLDELVGRVELLRPRAVDPWHPKAARLDLSAILAAAGAPAPRRFARARAVGPRPITSITT